MAEVVLVVGCGAGVVAAAFGYGFISFVRISMWMANDVDDAEEELFSEVNLEKENEENEG